MDRLCVICGGTFTAKRPQARMCSDRCRKRSQRSSGTPQGVQGAPVVPVAVPLPQSEDSAGLGAGVAESTRAKLVALDRLDSPLGQAAMVLARRLDNPGMDTGSSIASVARQYQLTMEAATEGEKVASDPLDELRARRDMKKRVL
jgi:hypothetical protein